MKLKISLLLLLISVGLYWFLKPTPVTAADYDREMKGKVILICGSSSGIGEELAYQLAEEGAQLVLVARTESKLLKVKENALAKGSPRVEIIPFDLSNVDESGVIVTKTIEIFGRLDHMYLNHAAMPSGPFLALKETQDPTFINNMFKINVFSSIQLTLHALPYLEQTKGHIFVTSSIAGEIPIYNSGIYCSTKHALNGFFYSLQQELLAKSSPVTISIGALGLIMTPDMIEIVKTSDSSVPEFIKGDMKECVTGMKNTLVTRQRTLTYPPYFGYLIRASWYFNPKYHENMVLRRPYDKALDELKIKAKVAEERDFQRGYIKTS